MNGIRRNPTPVRAVEPTSRSPAVVNFILPPDTIEFDCRDKIVEVETKYEEFELPIIVLNFDKVKK